MKQQTINAVPYPRGYEKQLEDFCEKMITDCQKQYFNNTFKKLNKGTVAKFADAQTGNYAVVFSKLSNTVRRALKRRYNNKRLLKEVTRIFNGIANQNAQYTYSELEKIGIIGKKLLIGDRITPQLNANIKRTFDWIKKELDDTLAYYANTALTLMTEGKTLDDIEHSFNETAKKRVDHAKFTARNEIGTYNGLLNKLRYEKLGIKKAIWVTSKDERVRQSHRKLDGKEFFLHKGINGLMPGIDYQCRCRAKPIIPDEFYK